MPHSREDERTATDASYEWSKEHWLSQLRSKAASVPATSTTATQNESQLCEILPPWVEHPGVPPWDFFWREAGEAWRTEVWQPYYNALSESKKAEYLRRWNVPDEWYKSYFDLDRREFWDHVDDPENE